MIVSNIVNSRGNRAVNQFVIRTCNGVFFQSYDSVIAHIDTNGFLTLSANWDYSHTTMKHLYIFLRQNGFGNYDNCKAVRAALANGDIIYSNVPSLAA